MFSIIDTKTGANVTNHRGEIVLFEDLIKASKFCVSYSRMGKVYKVHEYKTDKEWRSREERHLQDGTYSCIPSFLDPYTLKDHYLHLSKKIPLLEYTQSEIKGSQGVLSSISLKGYLENYHPDMKRKEITRLEKEYSDFVMQTDGLLFAATKEEITRVYRQYNKHSASLSASCMRHSFKHLPCHPCAVYAAGDLQVAYLKNENGETTSRSLVWPQKKLYSRVYGDGSLHGLLKIRGYRKSSYYGKDQGCKDDGSPLYPAMVGAQLLKIKIPGNSAYVLPFIDDIVGVEIKSNHIELVDYRQSVCSVTNRSGATVSKLDPTHLCARCGANHNGLFRYVYHNGSDRNQWCIPCVNEESYRCEATGFYYTNEVKKYNMETGGVWSHLAFRSSGFTCAATGKNYPTTLSVEVWIKEEGTNEFIPQRWFRDHADKNAQYVDSAYFCKTIPFPEIMEFVTGGNVGGFGNILNVPLSSIAENIQITWTPTTTTLTTTTWTRRIIDDIGS